MRPTQPTIRDCTSHNIDRDLNLKKKSKFYFISFIVGFISDLVVVLGLRSQTKRLKASDKANAGLFEHF